MMDDGGNAGKDETMRNGVDGQDVVGVRDVAIEPAPSTGDDGAAADGGGGGDRERGQIYAARRDHAAEADVDRCGIKAEKRVEPRFDIVGIREDQCVRADDIWRAVVAERSEIAIGGD